MYQTLSTHLSMRSMDVQDTCFVPISETYDQRDFAMVPRHLITGEQCQKAIFPSLISSEYQISTVSIAALKCLFKILREMIRYGEGFDELNS